GFLEDAVLKTYERYYNDYLKEKDSNKDNNTLTGTGSSSAGGAPGLPPDDDDDKSPKESSRNSDKKGVGGNGASSELPNLDGKSPEQARKILEKYGFEEKSISPAGYQRFVAKDGSEITINWNSGRIVRTTAPKYGTNGARINKGQRLDANGREIPRDVLHNQHPTETLNIK
ncbi:PASTA domain-containing protein, partial [Gilliamella sp. Bif1-4]